jgi:eukaryotic-like serine/threonine-protein kinase
MAMEEPVSGAEGEGRAGQAEEIALRVHERPEGEWEEAVEEACGGDPVLEEEVRALLRAFADAESYFRRMGVMSGALLGTTDGEDAARVGDEAEAPADPLPETLGPWKVRGLLGRGGMGAVYLAEREEPDYRQTVAVKVLHAHLAGGPFRERFISERRILAALSHPGIARFIDGGWLADGRPFLAMEFVEGDDLVSWADARKLGIRERVRLFLQVCRAVDYAHRKLVVHRDLKPSNTRVTDDGTVKLLDFGIARVLDADDGETGEGEITRIHPFSGRPLTPAYASPEQLRGEPIGTSTDVYSMGVLLWRLLAGEVPTRGEGRSHPTHDDPSSLVPGEIVRSEGQLRPTAERRGLPPETFLRALRGDLAAILQTAIRPEPDARYPSAAALGDDLVRFLEGRPVAVRAGSRSYRVRRFVVRNGWGIAAGVVALAALGGGVAGVWAHSTRMEVERDRATLEAERAQAATAFLLDLFDVAGEGTALDTVRAGTLLQRGEDRLRERTAAHPMIQAELLGALAQANGRLGRDEAEARLREERLVVLEEHLGDATVAFVRELRELGRFRVGVYHWERARETLSRALETLDAVEARGEGPDPALRASILSSLALAYRFTGETDAAVAAGERALELRGALTNDEESDALLRTTMDLASALRGADRLDEAESLMRRALEAATAREDMNVRILGRIHNDLASLLRHTGRPEESEVHYREALDIVRAEHGPDADVTETVTGNLARLLASEGRHEEAEALADTLRVEILKAYPPDHWRAGRVTLRLGWAWIESGRCERGLPWLVEGAAVYEGALGPEHDWTVGAVIDVAECELSMGRGTEAEVKLRWALDVVDSKGPGAPLGARFLQARELLLTHLQTTGRGAEADELEARWAAGTGGGGA